jgi:bifunctional non-homologous end joining protein LigD
MLWDWGTWEPLDGFSDVDACLRNGFRFRLNGEKLKGIWVLKRVSRFEGDRRNPVWVLKKEQDAFARSEAEPSIVDEAANSVSTLRTLEEIAEDWSRGKRKNKLQGKLFD